MTRPRPVDPVAVERAAAGQRVPLNITERAAAVAALKSEGLTDRDIAARLHIGTRSVSRIRTRCAIPVQRPPDEIRWAAARAAALLRSRLTDGAWWERAACSGLAERDHDPWFASENNSASVVTALAICSTCAVRAPCLRTAMDAERLAPRSRQARWGIFGGTTPEQRHRIAQRGEGR